MTPAEAHAYLEALTPSTMRMGLERITRALDVLGHPERSFKAVHVAGTNGKGSTCAMIEACLRQRVRTGFYSSPHLVTVNERFKVNGVDLDDEVLAVRVTELLERLGRDHELTYFEFGTALAFWHFQQERVEYGIIETGLGGRLDATVLCQPVVTTITSIAFDHMEFLGPTLTAIAGEKAGIAKPGIPLITCRQDPEVVNVLSDAAGRVGAPLLLEGRDFEFKDGEFRGRRTIDRLTPPLSGPHQVQNTALALATLEQLPLALTDDALRAGLGRTRWPGRLEELPGAPTILLDGAHNPAGVEALVVALDRLYPDRRIHLVFGVFADKDSEPMMRRLFPRATSVTLTPLHSPRSRAPESYVELARRLCSQVVTAASVDAALGETIARAGHADLVLIAGSLHLVGEARAALRRRFDDLLVALGNFTPGDDPETTMRALSALLAGTSTALDPPRYRQAVFALLERFPDSEFGTPGPLIHAIERDGGFEADLLASLQRQPTFLTVTMANRAANLSPGDERWCPCLDACARHPLAPDWVQKAARRYLEHQRAR